jgi:hypothetical protein
MALAVPGDEFEGAAWQRGTHASRAEQRGAASSKVKRAGAANRSGIRLAAANELRLRMISETKTVEIAREFIARVASAVDGGVAISLPETMRMTYGWTFFYNSRRYLETGDPLETLGGNGPIVVEHDGRLHVLPSSTDPAVAIMEFEVDNGFRSVP